MSVVAVIMAGGASRRMGRPKPLVEVRGLTLLERALGEVVRSGVASEIHVVTPAHTPSIGAWWAARAVAWSKALPLDLHHHIELVPRGNVGALTELDLGTSDVLLMFADNVSNLSLSNLVAHHHAEATSMTLATRQWTVQCPFGALDIGDGGVQRYNEKPWIERTISSGVYVLGPSARAALPDHGCCGASELVQAVLSRSLRVTAHQDDGPWVDVNTPADVLLAAELVGAHSAQERLAFPRPPREVKVGCDTEAVLDHISVDGEAWRLHLQHDGGPIPSDLVHDPIINARVASWVTA